MMLTKEFHISKLIAGHLRGDLDNIQKEELQNWLKESPKNQKYFEEWTSEEKLAQKLQKLHITDKASIWDKTMAGINTKLPTLNAQEKEEQSQPIKSRLWLRITAAASIILFGVWAIYTYQFQTNKAVPLIAKQSIDISPGKNRATLTLANGNKVILSEAIDGQIAQQSGVNVSKTADGQLIYTLEADSKAGGNHSAKEPSYNMLTTAIGEKYQVILPDGTKVWLNTGSSLKFPVSFNGQSERKVALTGEGYFEVAKLIIPATKNKIAKKVPFIVSTADQEVEVLGTQFNINSYSDEAATCTSLLEGSVKVHSLARNTGQLLRPGQQSLLKEGQLAVSEADVENSIAWKNGDFVFKNEDFKTIMRKIARWYNVEVIYASSAPTDVPLGGKISSSKNLSAILSVIQATGDVHFEVEGRRVTVTR